MTAGPPLGAISHVALTVPDLSGAEDFWGRVMGLELAESAPGLRLFVHREGRFGVAVTDHHGAAHGRFDEQHVGLDHVAFEVPTAESLVGWQERFAALGVPHSPPVESPGGLHLNARAPGEVPVELFWMTDAALARFGLSRQVSSR